MNFGTFCMLQVLCAALRNDAYRKYFVRFIFSHIFGLSAYSAMFIFFERSSNFLPGCIFDKTDGFMSTSTKADCPTLQIATALTDMQPQTPQVESQEADSAQFFSECGLCVEDMVMGSEPPPQSPVPSPSAQSVSHVSSRSISPPRSSVLHQTLSPCRRTPSTSCRASTHQRSPVCRRFPATRRRSPSPNRMLPPLHRRSPSPG
jgi:hypothetical protein